MTLKVRKENNSTSPSIFLANDPFAYFSIFIKMIKTMDSITITPNDPEDLELLASIAHKMGFRAEISTDGKAVPKQRADEVTFMSEPSLAQDWLSAEDEVYNDL